MRIGGRVPDIGVDPVDDAIEVHRTAADQSVEPHTELRGSDLLRVGRTDCRDRPGGLQARLEEPDAAVILDAIQSHGAHRQAELHEDRGTELALECKIVNGDGRRYADRLSETHIGECECRLPIVHMYELWQ